MQVTSYDIKLLRLLKENPELFVQVKHILLFDNIRNKYIDLLYTIIKKIFINDFYNFAKRKRILKKIEINLRDQHKISYTYKFSLKTYMKSQIASYHYPSNLMYCLFDFDYTHEPCVYWFNIAQEWRAYIKKIKEQSIFFKDIEI